jgi:Phosphotransferase enzyme family
MRKETGQRVETAELRAALERVLERRVLRLRRRRSAYASSYVIENLDVETARGKKLRLIWKDLSPGSLESSRHVRPRFLCDPRREILTHQNILTGARLGTPVYAGAEMSAEAARYWLFLERVDGLLLWQSGALEHWDDAARWLAGLHGKFSGARGLARAEHLLRHDAKFFEVWLGRAEQFLAGKPGGLPKEKARQFARLAGRYGRVVERLTGLPLTLVHGEFYPSNVILRRGAARGRQICPVDWEVAGIGPGLADLAALASGEWEEREKRRFVAAYREALGARESLAELVEAVEFCQLHLAVQLLGWAADWTPPGPHSRNWLETALKMGKKLGVTA